MSFLKLILTFSINKELRQKKTVLTRNVNFRFTCGFYVDQIWDLHGAIILLVYS